MTDPLTAETAPSLRAILSERAPDLLAALDAYHDAWRDRPPPMAQENRDLLDAIARAGLLAEPSQPAPLPAMFCGADAFEGEG